MTKWFSWLKWLKKDRINLNLTMDETQIIILALITKIDMLRNTEKLNGITSDNKEKMRELLQNISDKHSEKVFKEINK